MTDDKHEGLDEDGGLDSLDDKRPRVMAGFDVHRVLDDLDEALAKTDPLLFQRSNELVLVVGSMGSEGYKREGKGTPILRGVSSAALLPRVTEHVNYVRRSKPSPAEVTQAKAEDRRPQWEQVKCIPPPSVLSSFIEKSHWSFVRTIKGITGCPFPRPDGSIVQDEGFDELTGYLYLPNIEYPRVPDHPTQADAKEALEELKNVFIDFPHVTDADRMVPIAAAMTVIARPSILGSIPAFIFDASTRGSGKTLQCDVVSAIATGHPAERQSFPSEEVELEKTLCAYALAGAPIILLDNVTRKFGGGPLDKVLTARGDVGFRKLGGMDIHTLPWVSTVMASGNGITFQDDTTRRVLVSRLESPLEKPETREIFVHDRLIPWVISERARLVAGLLTILRAYQKAHCPDMRVGRWGSFEEWTDLVPHALVFAGGANVLHARVSDEATAGTGQESESLGAIQEGMLLLFGSGSATASDVIRAAFGDRGKDPAFDAMREAIRQVTKCRMKDDVDPITLGTYLRSKRGRVIGRRRIERERTESKHRGSARWCIR